MSNSIGLACFFISLLFLANPRNERFAKYKHVEAYEIRSGVLMMPRYSADGEVCEVGIQKRNYSPEIVRLDSSLSAKKLTKFSRSLHRSMREAPSQTTASEPIYSSELAPV
jgi:hypothetical protein